jgi:hypothetical protein
MVKEPNLNSSPEVQALRIILVILLVIYGTTSIVSLLFAVRVFPSVVKTSGGTSFYMLAEMIRVALERIAPGVVYFFIGWGIFKLIALVSRKEPFSPASPRYIRRIGYAVLVLAGVTAVIDVIKQLRWPVEVFSKFFMSAACSILSMILVGFGFLVIARVIEVGVRLQQDQNLTI